MSYQPDNFRRNLARCSQIPPLNCIRKVIPPAATKTCAGCDSNRSTEPKRVDPRYALPLTALSPQEIIAQPGIRDIRVRWFTPSRIEEHYERLQPQGGRRVGARQQDCSRGRREDRERDSGVHQVPERRGGARHAAALDESPPRSLGEALGVRRLHGEKSASSEVALLDSTKYSREQSPSVELFPRATSLALLFAILLLGSCGRS